MSWEVLSELIDVEPNLFGTAIGEMNTEILHALLKGIDGSDQIGQGFGHGVEGDVFFVHVAEI